MGRYGLRQLCVFVLACGVYFGGIPHMYFLGLAGSVPTTSWRLLSRRFSRGFCWRPSTSTGDSGRRWQYIACVWR